MTVYIMTKPPEVHTLWNAIRYLQDSVGWPHFHHDPVIVGAIKLVSWRDQLENVLEEISKYSAFPIHSTQSS